MSPDPRGWWSGADDCAKVNGLCGGLSCVSHDSLEGDAGNVSSSVSFQRRSYSDKDQVGSDLRLADAGSLARHILRGPEGSQQKIRRRDGGQHHNPLGGSVFGVDHPTDPPPAIIGWLGLIAAIGLTVGAAEVFRRKYGPNQPNRGRRRDGDSDP